MLKKIKTSPKKRKIRSKNKSRSKRKSKKKDSGLNEQLQRLKKRPKSPKKSSMFDEFEYKEDNKKNKKDKNKNYEFKMILNLLNEINNKLSFNRSSTIPISIGRIEGLAKEYTSPGVNETDVALPGSGSNDTIQILGNSNIPKSAVKAFSSFSPILSPSSNTNPFTPISPSSNTNTFTPISPSSNTSS